MHRDRRRGPYAVVPPGDEGGRHADRHLDVGQMRMRVADAVDRRFGGRSALARAFVLAVTGLDSVEEAELRACIDLSDYLEHGSEDGLRALARRGILPRATVRLEVRLALRGELDARRLHRLVAHVERSLRDPETVPPGLSVEAVVIACDDGREPG